MSTCVVTGSVMVLSSWLVAQAAAKMAMEICSSWPSGTPLSLRCATPMLVSMPVTTTKWFCLVRSPVDLFGVTVRLAIWHLGSTGAGWRGNGVVNHGQGEHGATQDNGEYWYSGQCGSFPDGLRRGSFDSWPGQAPTPKAVAALRWPTSAPIRTCEPVRSGSRGQCACAHTVWHQFGGVLAPEGSPAQRHAEESHRSG